MRLVLLGAPGSGKGTQAKILQDHFKVQWLSLGDMLRDEVKKDSVLGRQIKSIMEKGELVSDAVVSQVIEEHIDPEGFILDGFPRTIAQAGILDTILEKKGSAIDHVIYFDVSEETVLTRLSGRRICPKCGANYHVKNIPPRQEGICDVCGSELIVRKDDTPEVIRRRWEVFMKESKPLMDYYKEKGILMSCDANGNAQELFREIIEKINDGK